VLAIFSFTAISVQGAVYQMVAHGVSTGGLFLGLGMIYDRRHTYEMKQFGGLVNPMPILMAFFLFICLSSLALPPLNGFVGEFLILIGVFENHHAWAAWAASGAVLSAIYLLWSYQRVALGEVTVEKNRQLQDASARERVILVTISVVIIVMGVGSTLFTSRMEPSANRLLNETSRNGTIEYGVRPPAYTPRSTIDRAATTASVPHASLLPVAATQSASTNPAAGQVAR
jgi:NADH-quinone oxidoreductase subunit M